MNKITLMADAEIDPNGYRVFINKTLFSCGVSDINDAMRAERLADAEKKLEDACDEIIALRRRLEELDTVSLFWRQAAEHAVTGWNALEDEHDLLKETLRALAAVEPAPLAVSKEAVEGLIDLGDGVKLRVVETERLIDEDVPPKENK